jgi:hypothetical protein
MGRPTLAERESSMVSAREPGIRCCIEIQKSRFLQRLPGKLLG